MNPENTIESDSSCLWREFRLSGDNALKQKIIEKYLGVAKRHAAAIYKIRANNAIDYSDYYHFAVIGLLEAIKSYKYDLNDYFPSYAKHRIRGAIFDGLARMTEKANQISQNVHYQQRLVSFLEPDEHTSELFDEMVNLSISLTIGAVLDVQEGLSVLLNDYNNHEITELKQLLTVCIDKLPRDERMVINYHYFYDVDFVVIADILELSKGRVSQIHKSAINTIRRFYETELQLDTSF